MLSLTHEFPELQITGGQENFGCMCFVASLPSATGQFEDQILGTVSPAGLVLVFSS